MKTVSKVRKKVRQHTRLWQLREDAGLTLREVSGFSDISLPTLSRVEAGRIPDLTTALRFAQFYETTVEDLFGHFVAKP
jgi:transcriptional regulator with XRE-family HTH domain